MMHIFAIANKNAPTQDFKVRNKSCSSRLNGLAAGGVLALVATVATALPFDAAHASSEKEAIAAISDHYKKVPTMTGEFVQFGPDGSQTGGKFYLQRPGKIRFNYNKPSTVQVISNGRTVAVNNTRLNTWNFYPLSKTPLKLLLDKKLNFAKGSIKDVEVTDDLTTVVMGDKHVFGNSEITLLFDPKNYDLRQWTIKDPQGKETSVMIFNVQKNVKIPTGYFVVDKQSKLQKRGKHNR